MSRFIEFQSSIFLGLRFYLMKYRKETSKIKKNMQQINRQQNLKTQYLNSDLNKQKGIKDIDGYII